jgi:hypothetical protein
VLVRITILLLTLGVSIGKAQNEPFLFDDQLLHTLEYQRLRSNAVVKISGDQVLWQEFDHYSSKSLDSLKVKFNSDSIYWSFVRENVRFEVKVPNDISLLLDGDRGQLQDRLFESLAADSSARFNFRADTTMCDTLWQLRDQRYELLRSISVIDKCDSLPVCNLSTPIASAINSINNTADCDGLFPVMLVFNRYGFKRDTLITDIASIVRVTGVSDWKKWFATEESELTVMFQHPYFAFDHMLFLKPYEFNNVSHWLGEMHSFIPTHNLGELYGKYVNKEGAERFEIK